MKLNRNEIPCQLFALMNEAEVALQTNADSTDENSDNEVNERLSDLNIYIYRSLFIVRAVVCTLLTLTS